MCSADPMTNNQSGRSSVRARTRPAASCRCSPPARGDRSGFPRGRDLFAEVVPEHLLDGGSPDRVAPGARSSGALAATWRAIANAASMRDMVTASGEGGSSTARVVPRRRTTRLVTHNYRPRDEDDVMGTLRLMVWPAEREAWLSTRSAHRHQPEQLRWIVNRRPVEADDDVSRRSPASNASEF